MVSSKLDARLKAIEAGRGSSEIDIERALDAEAFKRQILTLADRFPASEADTTLPERLGRYSPAMRLAWALRFGSELERASALDEAQRYAGDGGFAHPGA